MRILVVSGKSHIPERSGGVPSTTHELAIAARQKGHTVAVLCGLEGRGGTGLYLRAMRRLFGCDRQAGYPVYRRWNVLPSIAQIIKNFAPDIAIVQIGEAVKLAEEIASCGVPVMFCLHNIFVSELGGDPRALRNVRFVANSHFTARRYKDIFGIDADVIPPPMIAENYIAARNPSNITFINPEPMKGLDVVLQVAEKCPHIPFVLLESWSLSQSKLADLRRRIAKLPNVTIKRRTNDMRTIYSQAKLLMAPSRCEEAWGRVATEAHFSGIPVIATNIGGLPEAVGPGGVLLDVDAPIEAWVEVIERLWSEKEFYQEKAQAALTYSKRSEIKPEIQLDRFLEIAATMVAGAR